MIFAIFLNLKFGGRGLNLIAMTFVTILGVIKLLSGCNLVQEGKVGKQLPEC